MAIVTTAASADLAVLHHRVPVTIGADDFARWLDCSDDDAETVMTLMAPPHEGQFAWHEVSTRVNHVANDDAQLVLPITAEQREAEEPKPAKKPSPRKPAPAASDDGQGSLLLKLPRSGASRSPVEHCLQLRNRAVRRRQHRQA